MDIETLFDEDFCEISRCRLSNEEFVNTNEKSSSTYAALAAQLDEPAQTMLESLLDLKGKLTFMERRQSFIDGFSIATKLLTEALYTPISNSFKVRHNLTFSSFILFFYTKKSLFTN